MITANLKGGLCNMLFQIAATYVHAIKHNTTVRYPNMITHLKYLSDETTHNPKLKEANKYLLLFRKLDTSPQTPPRTMVHTPPFHHVEMPFKDGMHIDGFFQSEKYFNSHRDVILDILEPTDEIKNHIKNKYSDILQGDTLSVHVRRGDYVKSQDWHALLDKNYYYEAIDKIPNVDKIIVFSDDIPWCKENILGDNIIYIEGEEDYNELYLMSMCTNNIIANSSFSWWGAWLNQNEDKKVIAPKNWFGPNFHHFKTHDIIPKEWTLM